MGVVAKDKVDLFGMDFRISSTDWSRSNSDYSIIHCDAGNQVNYIYCSNRPSENQSTRDRSKLLQFCLKIDCAPPQVRKNQTICIGKTWLLHNTWNNVVYTSNNNKQTPSADWWVQRNRFSFAAICQSAASNTSAFLGIFSNKLSERKFMFIRSEQKKWKIRDEIHRLLMRMFKCTLRAIDSMCAYARMNLPNLTNRKKKKMLAVDSNEQRT